VEIISREEAMNDLHNYGIIIHGESIYGWRYKNFFGSDLEFSCYKLDGCVIIKYVSHCYNENGEYFISEKAQHITFNIHQISDEADICAVWRYIEENEKFNNTKRTIMLHVCAPLPEEIDIFMGFRKFSRKGEQYEDNDIRNMTENDKDIIIELCEDSCNNDTHFGKGEAQTFYSWFDYTTKNKLLGIFDNDKLAGLVSVKRYEKIEMALVSDLFIHKDYRRRGFGGRLVKAALALYPDIQYCYQAAKLNEASIELAKSLGFEFAGAELYALDEE